MLRIKDIPGSNYSTAQLDVAGTDFPMYRANCIFRLAAGFGLGLFALRGCEECLHTDNNFNNRFKLLLRHISARNATQACKHTTTHACMDAYTAIQTVRNIHPSIHPCMHTYIHEAVHRSIPGSVHPSMHSSVHPSIRPSVHPSIHPPPSQPAIHPSVHACIRAYIHTRIHPSIHPSIHASIHSLSQPASQPSIHPSIHPSVRACIHAYAHAHMHVHLHAAHVHAFRHTHACEHRHTNTHTHTLDTMCHRSQVRTKVIGVVTSWSRVSRLI